MATVAVTRAQQLQRGIHLEYLTVGWNVFEGLVAVASGSVSGSVALVGFGIDSFIETASGGVLLWRLRAERRGENAKNVERRALKLVGASFMLLAAYVAFDSIQSLIQREAPRRSVIGIGIALLSLLVMPWLARAKRKTAGHLGSASLRADARQSSICVYLSIILLGGLLLNALLGWWWADPVAALAMVPVIVHEGREALRGETCSDCHSIT
ncbi:MAG TPA: cation transporter [Candidatus Angelobacter sp.]|nr:cation transporter [Candidatus Angelobacter sp.]